MKKIFSHFVLAILSVYSCHVFADISDVRKPILINSDQAEFIITLPSNPSTGFIWLIDSYDAQLFKLVKHDSVVPKDKKIVGAPGVEQWVFEVKEKTIAPRITKITLVHARPWEVANVESEKKVFTIVME